MLDFNTVSGAVSGQGSGAQKTKNELGQQDFLKLMTTQMRNQDPFAPMENGEFLTQIAQFTTASGIGDLQKSFSAFQQNMSTDQSLRAASLVGREVLVESSVGNLPQDGSLTAVIEAPRALHNLTVGIYSTSGELIREIPLGQQSAGQVNFSWDGKAEDGRALPPGQYLISATTDLDGQSYALSTLASAKVDSVMLGNGQSPVLNLEGLGELSLSAVRQIR